MLGDWSSVFQLLCAYTLLVGGYVQYKASTEKAVERMLEDAAETMKRVTAHKKRFGLPVGEADEVTQFEWIDKWHELSTGQLNAHRKYLTSWYWERKFRTRKADEQRNTVIIYIGAIGFVLLLASAAAKNVELSPLAGTVISLALWLPVFLIMMDTSGEDAHLRGLSQYSEKPKVKPAQFSKEPFPGMIYAVTNHIRRHEIASGVTSSKTCLYPERGVRAAAE